MSDTLISFLHANQATLGVNYNHVSKTIGSGFGRQKILLVHDAKTGWGLVKLNLLQLFLRNIFGAYKNTHLNHVFKQLSQEKARQQVAFYPRMARIWAKKFLNIKGNAPLEQVN